MVKAYVLLLLFLSCYVTNGKQITVEYDEKSDVIIKDGKLYLPFVGSLTSVLSENGISVKDEVNNLVKAHGEVTGEAQEVSEGKFWFYIFMIGCNY